MFQSEGNSIAGGLNARNTERVRYCLSPQGDLYRQIQTWTTATPHAPPAETACPGKRAGPPENGVWVRTSVVAASVVNGNSRPIFTYNAATLKDITEVSATLWIDVNPATVKPPETTLQTSVYLRNQNRKPTAVFSLALANGGTALIMNASESTDPEEKPLTFTWIIDGTAVVGDDVVHTAQVTPGTHTVKVKVSDGPLDDTSDPQSICAPSPSQGVTCSTP